MYKNVMNGCLQGVQCLLVSCMFFYFLVDVISYDKRLVFCIGFLMHSLLNGPIVIFSVNWELLDYSLICSHQTTCYCCPLPLVTVFPFALLKPALTNIFHNAKLTTYIGAMPSGD